MGNEITFTATVVEIYNRKLLSLLCHFFQFNVVKLMVAWHLPEQAVFGSSPLLGRVWTESHLAPNSPSSLFVLNARLNPWDPPNPKKPFLE